MQAPRNPWICSVLPFSNSKQVFQRSFLEGEGHHCQRRKDYYESRRFLGGEGHHCQG